MASAGGYAFLAGNSSSGWKVASANSYTRPKEETLRGVGPGGADVRLVYGNSYFRALMGLERLPEAAAEEKKKKKREEKKEEVNLERDIKL
jgi:hypothetical protein